MSFKLLGGGSDLPTVISDVNQNVLELKNRETTEIFKDDTGIRRVLLGKGADGFYGLKVSKPTFDVYSAGDDELAFNSDQNVFKIVQTDTYNFTVDGTSSQFISIPHDLSFSPVIIAYISFSGNYNPLPTSLSSSSFTVLGATYVGFQSWLSFSVDQTNIYFNLDNPSGAYNGSIVPIKYYLLQETAN